MNYLIDFDTRQVEAKSEDADLLASYVLNNDLSLAVAVIDCGDELELQFSYNELKELYTNITGKEVDCNSSALTRSWKALEEHQDKFPDFTERLGKKLFKAGTKRSSDTARSTSPAPTHKAKPGNTEPKKPPQTRQRAGKLDGKTFTTGDTEPMKGRHTNMVNFIDDNFGEATYEELCEFLELEKGTPKEHIGFAVRKGFIKVIDNV